MTIPVSLLIKQLQSSQDSSPDLKAEKDAKVSALYELEDSRVHITSEDSAKEYRENSSTDRHELVQVSNVSTGCTRCNIINDRASSRDRMAFKIKFDDGCVSKKMPSTLQKKFNLTKEPLQSKLDAAEQHRKALESGQRMPTEDTNKLEHDRQVMDALEAFQKV